MPTSQNRDKEYYERIQELTEKENRNACKIIKRDWKALVREGRDEGRVRKF